MGSTIRWSDTEWENYLNLQIFLKIIVVKELLNNMNPSSTLRWVIGSSNGWMQVVG
jgi:hypothetical protein